ncbi:MAG: hypothetical protein JWR26_1438 [Pedosphaera sp.]|nr:hypothetical protein [Pedosphaera sp.]
MAANSIRLSRICQPNYAMKFVSVCIVTGHVPSLARFYEGVTGIAAVGCSEHYVEIPTPAGVIAICSKESLKLFIAGAAEPGANRSLILEFEVDDVDRERARLERIVDDFVMEPKNQPWRNRSMLFRDPDGNLINMFATVDWTEKSPDACGGQGVD